MHEHPHAALVRRGYEAFVAGDMATLRDLIAADATHHVPGSHPLSGDFKGREEILSMYSRLMEATGGTMRVELRDVMVDGRGHAVATHHVDAQRMGRTLDQMGCIVFRVVGDRVTDLDECVQDISVSDQFWA